MKELKGRKILILGATASCVHVTKFAKSMGAFVYVTDNVADCGPAKKHADEPVMISTADVEALTKFVRDNSVDGVMTGPGEFNIQNAIELCSSTGLPFYCNKEQWEVCQDKRNFKDFCKRFGLPGVPEFSVNEQLEKRDFPVIVKPVDGYSSKGINICWNEEEYKMAKEVALAASKSGKILVEKYVNNGGVTIDAKYVAIDGDYYLEAMGDRYVLNGGLITAVSFYPSKYLDCFMAQVHPYVKKAFSSIGLKNGAFFFQAIPDDEKIYIYEMGLRVSGGMIYNMTETTSGNNTLKMLIHYSVTGEMCEESDIKNIDVNFKGKIASTLSFPLRIGTIASFEGFDSIPAMKGVIDLTIYYEIGNTILQKHVNTLDQLFARVMVSADDEESLFDTLQAIRTIASVKNVKGEEMIIWDTYDHIYAKYKAEKGG